MPIIQTIQKRIHCLEKMEDLLEKVQAITIDKNKLILKIMNKELKRQKCECYTRVVGYLSPINRWNNGKKAEFDDRKVFKIK